MLKKSLKNIVNRRRVEVNRKKRTAVNATIGIFYKIICMVFPFLIRTIIIKILGDEYAGLNSLFTSIISALSLAELGVGNAVVYCMYEPIVKKENDKLCALLKYIKKMYNIIGTFVLAIGILITPFLKYLIKGDYPADVNLYILFFMYLFNLVFGYFFYGYTTSLFLAHQRNDVISVISLLVFAFQYIIQILILFFTHNYMLYILVFAIIVIPQNIMYKIISKKMYPEIRCQGEISDQLKKKIEVEVLSLLGHKIGAVILVSIDSALISAFLGLSELARYGNYYYIYSSVIALTTIIAQGMLAGIGAKIVDDKEATYDLFLRLSMAWMLMVTVCASCLVGLLNPFISMIFGRKYCYSEMVVLVMVVYYFSWQFRNMGLIFKDAAGLWSKDWYKPYIGMFINFIFSIFFLKLYGTVVAVLIPTIIVMVFLYYPIETIVIHKYLFKRKMWDYIIWTIKFVLFSIFTVGINNFICNYVIRNESVIVFIIKMIISIAVPSITFIVFYHKSDQFKVLKNDIRSIIKIEKI